MRSFGLVEEKIYETDFFLEKMKYCTDLHECKYYLSAFLSACRSITFALQASMSDVKGFKEWYEIVRKLMMENHLARFFHVARNESQKIGIYHISCGHPYKDKHGEGRMLFYFSKDYSFTNFKTYEESILEMLLRNEFGDELGPGDTEDVCTQCERHLKFLLGIIFDCFDKFGHVIDPKKYYTLENIKSLGLTIEDVEESLGYEKGWTKVNGISAEKRMELIRNHEPDSYIDPVFIKYLNKCRYQK